MEIRVLADEVLLNVISRNYGIFLVFVQIYIAENWSGWVIIGCEDHSGLIASFFVY